MEAVQFRGRIHHETYIEFATRIYSPSFTGDRVAELDTRRAEQSEICTRLRAELGGDTLAARREAVYQAELNETPSTVRARELRVYRASLY